MGLFGLVLLLSCDRGISGDAGIFWAFSLVNVPGAPLVECFAARFSGETNADPMWSCALALFIEYFPIRFRASVVAASPWASAIANFPSIFCARRRSFSSKIFLMNDCVFYLFFFIREVSLARSPGGWVRRGYFAAATPWPCRLHDDRTPRRPSTPARAKLVLPKGFDRLQSPQG